MQLQGSMLLHFVLQLKDGLLHVCDLRLLLLQLHALLLQDALLLGHLLLSLILELPVLPVHLHTHTGQAPSSTNMCHIICQIYFVLLVPK